MKSRWHLLLILFFPLNSFCQETEPVKDSAWLFASRNSQKEIIYMQAKALVDGESISVWTKAKSKTFKTKTGKVYLNVETKTYYSFKCAERKIQIKKVIIYSASNNVISSYTKNEFDDEYDDAVPETVGDDLLNKACELFNQ